MQTGTATLRENKAAYYAANRDELLAKAKQYAQANRDKIAAYAKEYRAANREKLQAHGAAWRAQREPGFTRAYNQAYYAANRDKIRARSREWHAKNPSWSRKNYEDNRERKLRGDSEKKRVLKAWLDGIKQASGCVDCGYNKCAEALEFDHVRGRKAGNISSMLSGRCGARVRAELVKCVVRCANCHRERHAGAPIEW